MQAKGTFEVKLTPAEGTAIEQEAGIGRMTIDKKWSGDLIGVSKGVMISTQVPATGAMAYTALEKFEGTLGDRSGSFYFSHSATMLKGDANSGVLKIAVVAASGTDGFAGLKGELSLNIAGGVHAYGFEYEVG